MVVRTGGFAAWVRAHVLAVDALLAVVLVAVCFPLVGSTDEATNPGLLLPVTADATYLWTVASVVPLAMRRWRPEPAAWMFVAWCVAHLLLGPVATYADVYALLMLYSALVYGNPAHTFRFVATGVIMGVAVAVIWAVTFDMGPAFGGSPLLSESWSSWSPTVDSLPVCAVGGGWRPSGVCLGKTAADAGIILSCVWACVASVTVMALWQRARRSVAEAMRERNAAIAAREEDEKRIAALAERARIARDMHDVVAHTLSTIIVQADGGRYAGAHDAAVAEHTMGTIRREAEHARRDMDRLFDVFGGSAGTGYADIPVLLDGRPPVPRRVDGDVRPERLSPDADAAVFRLVQEALSNVRRHAGEGAHVTLEETWGPDALRIVVRDDGVGAAAAADGHTPGYGLVGMRERIAAVGGHVDAAPGADGGFVVDATVPLAPSRRTAREGRSPASMPRMLVRLSTLWRPSGVAEGDPFATGAGPRMGWIGRASRWTQRHYLLMDVATAVMFLLLLRTVTFHDTGLYATGFAPLAARRALATMLTAVFLLPYALRRRFPEAAAATMAVLCAVELLTAPDILTVSVFALASVHAAVLYGRDGAAHWVLAAVLADSWLFGVKVAAGWNGYRTISDALTELAYGIPPAWLPTSLVAGGMMLLTCLACMAMAEWRRSSDSDVLVLRQREEALRAEESRQKVLAANMERERIAVAMRAEVAATLDAVSARADEGLAMLAGDPRPSPERIVASFAGIASQGRGALAHMRGLLATLRETGFSDGTHAGEGTKAPLSPAVPLDEQIAGSRAPDGDDSGRNQGFVPTDDRR
ncbi:histidine kinase [Bifidobacterium sp. CP2]|uniref:sensor histidine kinase n=1 Tax=Bifidobacterium sp. CP2 TaxID=2809025 RepID=UPI001BDCEF75|nr:histidine kinase [Bifidobacterium sp. CP2]MBT1181885.1 histidine kinase [Bifidobacterium sp. CP2]